MNGRTKHIGISVWLMADHMIQVVAAVDSTDTPGMTLTEINDAMDDWVSKQSEWEEDPTEHLIEKFTPEGKANFYAGTYRFELSDAKDNLLTKCEDKLKKKVDWYRLGYHNCDHDESERVGCSWDDVREYTSKNTTSIPSNAPTFL